MAEPPHDIRISLVVPVRNEAGTLGDLLDDIASQELAPDEVLFVDGGSLDGTPDLLRAAGTRFPAMRVIEAGDATPGRGRNVGIAAARNEWIALTDAGIRLEKDWLRNLAQAVASNPSLDIVYGSYEPVTDTFFEKCAALTYVSAKIDRGTGAMRGPSIVSCLLSRRLWEEVGGFPDWRAAEDLAFMERVSQRGSRTGWAPSATVHWILQPNLFATYRRFALYSKHNALAGRQWDWHYGIARIYASALALVLLAVLHHPGWLLALLSGLILRVGLTLWRRRQGRGFLWLLNPLQFATVAVILATIDFATFEGWVRAALSPRSRLVSSPPRPCSPHRPPS